MVREIIASCLLATYIDGISILTSHLLKKLQKKSIHLENIKKNKNKIHKRFNNDNRNFLILN